MNLRERFAVSLTGRAAEPALEWQGRVFTFGEIDARSNRMAHALRARGLSSGDRLCIYLSNSVEFIDLYLACIKLGVIFVPINILYRERELSHILSDADPKLYLTAAELPALFAEAAQQPAELEPVPLDEDSPAALVYTSGTTGTSKGAILTHNNFYVNGAVLNEAWRITAKDRFLLALPLFHVHALGNGLHCWLLSGCRMRLLERFEHEKATSEFLDFRPTLFFGVPTIYVRLLETPPDTARDIGRTMRLFVSGSAPLPAQVLESFRALFGHTILERYGMTETFMIISNPYEGERRPGSVGFPLPGTTVRVVDPEGRDVPDGETGEVCLKGPNVFAGYWRRDEATRNAFFDGGVKDGWFKTGDLCVRSSDGYHTLCGRKSDLIISGGFNIYPREIEEFLMEQPGVAEAAVAAEAHPVRGEVPVAYIVPKTAGVDTATLDAACRANFASFKIPRHFEIVDKLPRNALGKVQKHLLGEGGRLMKILMVSSEAAPFAKTGGLADVLASLPEALTRLGDEVAVVLPKYVSVDAPGARRVMSSVALNVGPRTLYIGVDELTVNGVRYFFVDSPELYTRGGIYGDIFGGFGDNHIRYMALTQAAIAIARYRFRADIFHAHDWQGGLLPVLLKTALALDPAFLKARTVFTIHNLGYQGNFGPLTLGELGLPPALYTPGGVEFYSQVSFMKAGITWADAVTTVSPTYAREIQTPGYGFGMDGVLRTHAGKLTGILNGVDYSVWSPEIDPHLPAHYSAGALTGKLVSKRAVLAEMGLPSGTPGSDARPLLAIVSRFAEQKGLDLVAGIAGWLTSQNVALAVLGSGDGNLESLFTSLAAAYPDRVAVRLGYHDALAHRLEGGADMFLMPSRYEPCGLNQIYSLRYGTVPVVRATGGLADTVDATTGFLFSDFSPIALQGAIANALAAFRNRTAWTDRMVRGMARDFSWDASAQDYRDLYHEHAAVTEFG